MEQAETCCFTGHRPDKLPWGVREDDPRCTDLKARLAAALEAEYDAGTRHFICGMARGADLYFAEAVLALRSAAPASPWRPPAPVRAASRWPQEEQRRYQSIFGAVRL